MFQIFSKLYHFSHRKFSVKFVKETLVNGKWIKSSDNSVFPVLNPATGETLAELPDLTVNDTDEAMDAADISFKTWRNVPAIDRSRILRKLSDIILKNEDELSKLITMENGKCLADALSEVRYAASYFEWFSEEPRRISGEVFSNIPDREILVLKQPIGPVSVITPWNFPLAMVTRKLGAILAAGCTSVIKPAEDTPLTLLRFVDLTKDLLPDGVINVITSSRKNGPMIGRAFCTDTRIKAVTFTGSSEVGKILYKQSGDTMKRLSLELGGNASMIIFESANIDLAVKACFTSKFRNSGQTCVCSNRIKVHEKVHDEFVEKLKKAVSTNLTVGYGLDKGVNQGPLINKEAVRKVEQLINRSVDMGAKIEMGGMRQELQNYPKGNFFMPTVITDCSSEQPLHTNEQFGPIAAISKFQTEEEAVRRANKTKMGLANYIVSEDHRQIWRVSRQLNCGIIGVNEGIVTACEVPIEGWKESGLGVESGRHGIDEYLQYKSVVWGNLYQ